jgi:hypothetical protein
VSVRPSKLDRPDVHFDAILALVGVLLGFLFIVVIYILEYPQEFLSTWGMPLIMFLTICYAIGLTIMAAIISHEISFYLANKTLALEADKFPADKFERLYQNTQKMLRRTVQMLLYFIFSFGLFLINLACFTISKLFAAFFVSIEITITVLWGPIVLVLIRLGVMFLVQLILIIPFAQFQGNLWDSYKSIEKLQNKRPPPDE